MRSDLAVAGRDGLAEAGIEVPMPQREMHLRSVPGAVVPAAAQGGGVVPATGGIAPESPDAGG